MRYKLQNRYQDSGWEELGEQFSNLNDANRRAHDLSKDAICYGMVRVVDVTNGIVEAEYPAGGP